MPLLCHGVCAVPLVSAFLSPSSVAWAAAVGCGTTTIEEYTRAGRVGYRTRVVATSTFKYIHFRD